MEVALGFLTIYGGYMCFKKVVSQEPESNWVKFWNLFSSVKSEYTNKISLPVVLDMYSFYKTVKIVAISKYEDFVNSHLLRMLTPIELENNKMLVPMFIHDNKYYLCIEKTSEVRKYDVIGVTARADLVPVFNRLVSSETTPYRTSYIRPCDVGSDIMVVTILKDIDMDTIRLTKLDELRIA
jgi:hypothetical protein